MSKLVDISVGAWRRSDGQIGVTARFGLTSPFNAAQILSPAEVQFLVATYGAIPPAEPKENDRYRKLIEKAIENALEQVCIDLKEL